MNLVHVHCPVVIPCVVYVKHRANSPYQFSHICDVNQFYKVLPSNLMLNTLSQYRPADILRSYLRHVVMVLVSGDTARCLTVDQNWKEATVFLYYKSQYSVVSNTYDHECCEVHKDYISWKLNSTLSYYEHGLFQVKLSDLFMFILYVMTVRFIRDSQSSHPV